MNQNSPEPPLSPVFVPAIGVRTEPNGFGCEPNRAESVLRVASRVSPRRSSLVVHIEISQWVHQEEE